jgi:iron-sulfur cluster assembly protein
MTVSLTENAVRHITEMLKQRGHGIGLRLGIKTYGCSGYGYDVDYADSVTDSDSVFETNGVKIVIENSKLNLVDGLVIDFVKNNVLNEGFEFRNPNAKNLCGCGESFNV